MAAENHQFDNISDLELRRKLQDTMSSHTKAALAVPKSVAGRPRYVFSRSTPDRSPGSMVKVRNGLDENMRGGSILETVGRAYRVQVDDLILIVHEPEDSWEE